MDDDYYQVDGDGTLYEAAIWALTGLVVLAGVPVLIFWYGFGDWSTPSSSLASIGELFVLATGVVIGLATLGVIVGGCILLGYALFALVRRVRRLWELSGH